MDKLRSQISFIQHRLSSVTDGAANLMAELSELNELRERVRKAQLSAQISRRIDRRKRPRI
jgi:hypothetical protein